MKCKIAFWHFNVALLDDNVFRDTFKAFWDGFKNTKSEYISFQQWWDIGKSKIKQLCLKYTLNVTKDLEREILELQQLADSTGKENTLMFSKGKKLLSPTC